MSEDSIGWGMAWGLGGDVLSRWKGRKIVGISKGMLHSTYYKREISKSCRGFIWSYACFCDAFSRVFAL